MPPLVAVVPAPVPVAAAALLAAESFVPVGPVAVPVPAIQSAFSDAHDDPLPE